MVHNLLLRRRTVLLKGLQRSCPAISIANCSPFSKGGCTASNTASCRTSCAASDATFTSRTKRKNAEDISEAENKQTDKATSICLSLQVRISRVFDSVAHLCLSEIAHLTAQPTAQLAAQLTAQLTGQMAAKLTRRRLPSQPAGSCFLAREIWKRITLLVICEHA